MLDAALQKLLSVIDSLVPSSSHAGSGGSSENASGSGNGSSSAAPAAPSSSGEGASSSSSSLTSLRLLYEASPAIPASAGKPARGPEYRVHSAKKGWPKLEGAETLYELWTTSVEKFGPRRCLGWRPKVRER